VAPHLPLVASRTIFCKSLGERSANAPRPFKTSNAFDSSSFSMSFPASAMSKQANASDCPLGKCDAGDSAGAKAISPSTIVRDVAERRLFPPLDRALVTAIACETVAQTKQPLSRQSLSDLTRRANEVLPEPMSRSTLWRILHDDAIKPWQFKHWIFPRDPQFEAKATPILDLYAGLWEGKPLGPKDYVLSSDEKTSIQARQRTHEETPPRPGEHRRVEPQYKRKGALQYLAMWDVHRGTVMGRCESHTGITPFGRLVDQVLSHPPYDNADRLFIVVDNGSSHRGKASIRRMTKRDTRITLLHTPIHASWLNQVEIYFSIIQRKVLTPNDFPDLAAVRLRLALYEELSNRQPKPFRWKFTREKFADWLKRAAPHFLPAKAA
jgi:hypothetical protein